MQASYHLLFEKKLYQHNIRKYLRLWMCLSKFSNYDYNLIFAESANVMQNNHTVELVESLFVREMFALKIVNKDNGK